MDRKLIVAISAALLVSAGFAMAEGGTPAIGSDDATTGNASGNATGNVSDNGTGSFSGNDTGNFTGSDAPEVGNGTANATAPPPAFGTCNAYEHNAEGREHGHAGDAEPFAAMNSSAAARNESVDSYCQGAAHPGNGTMEHEDHGNATGNETEDHGYANATMEHDSHGNATGNETESHSYGNATEDGGNAAAASSHRSSGDDGAPSASRSSSSGERDY